MEFSKGYHPAKFQFCRLSGSSFTEGSQKHNDDVIMTSFHNLGIQNFNILSETGYMQSLKSVSYLNQIYRDFYKTPQDTIMTSL